MADRLTDDLANRRLQPLGHLTLLHRRVPAPRRATPIFQHSHQGPVREMWRRLHVGHEGETNSSSRTIREHPDRFTCRASFMNPAIALSQFLCLVAGS